MLRWRSQELSDARGDVLPFIIDWEGPASRHPGRVPVVDGSGASSIRRVVLGDPDTAGARSRLELVLGRVPGARRADSGVIYEVRESSWSGVLAIVVATAGGDLLIS